MILTVAFGEMDGAILHINGQFKRKYKKFVLLHEILTLALESLITSILSLYNLVKFLLYSHCHVYVSSQLDVA